jgi:hypothetical protein
LKRVVLGTLALVVALAMILPIAGVVMAQPELTTEVAPAVKLALAIRAPDEANVGQLVTIKVVERHSGRPASKAGVWAINISDIKSETNDAEAYASLAEKCGYFLGWTDRNGNVFHRFREPGQYVLVAVKDGFIPGFAKITIKPLKALAIKAPETAWVGQLVTIKVVDKHVNTPVPRAAVYAINVNDLVKKVEVAEVQAISVEAVVRQVDVSVAPAISMREVANEIDDAEAYVEMAKRRGYFVGWTNEDGEVQYRFREAGRYVLVAVKDGYVPGFTRITIRRLQLVPAEPILRLVEPLKITVFE